MKITLAGSPGSGKSTLRMLLAEHYGLSTKGTGDFMRKLSAKYGYSDITQFLVEYVSVHPEVDHQVDEEQRIFGKENDDFVLDAHLGFHFVPDSIRICLICDLEEAARRILDDTERTTEDATNIRGSINASKKRRDTMRKNFMSLYQVDIDDHSNFDVVLDTTSLSSAEVFERASAFIDLQRA
ncbi:MAG: AAA family ATPase [SAR324 cluster bacterium]|jgi:predicted cytidylate kinase|nr:AAA family ATPase [SAR324 cluster bacterium]MDP6743557.1 AAA family ATPase [SAR324 cluster bacterium]MDP7047099.1 AAA family ATPase [SAR324 cluster bacterium]MEC7886984.1 AAA family ATPase [SAR324 cluster bacterium]MEC8980102.1 AAA family ATPase [SAR324 cluster bacterium]